VHAHGALRMFAHSLARVRELMYLQCICFDQACVVNVHACMHVCVCVCVCACRSDDDLAGTGRSLGKTNTKKMSMHVCEEKLPMLPNARINPRGVCVHLFCHAFPNSHRCRRFICIAAAFLFVLLLSLYLNCCCLFYVYYYCLFICIGC